MRESGNLSEPHFEKLADSFKVLSDPLRLKIVNCLYHKEKCVNELVEETGARQSNVSKHLGILADHDVVERRKIGLYVYYRLSDGFLVEMLKFAINKKEELAE